jgi:hypothetical protein
MCRWEIRRDASRDQRRGPAPCEHGPTRAAYPSAVAYFRQRDALRGKAGRVAEFTAFLTRPYPLLPCQYRFRFARITARAPVPVQFRIALKIAKQPRSCRCHTTRPAEIGHRTAAQVFRDVAVEVCYLITLILLVPPSSANRSVIAGLTLPKASLLSCRWTPSRRPSRTEITILSNLAHELQSAFKKATRSAFS